MRFVARQGYRHLHGVAITLQRQLGVLRLLVHPVGHLLGHLLFRPQRIGIRQRCGIGEATRVRR